MRVAYISSFPPKRCGIGEYSGELVPHLRKAGNEVLVVGDPPSSSADLTADMGSRQGIEDLRRGLRAFRPELIHLQWEPGLFSRKTRLRLPAWLAKEETPRVITFHSLAQVVENSARGRASAWLSSRAERTLARSPKSVLTSTTIAMRKALGERYGVANVKITPLGIEPKRKAGGFPGRDAPFIAFGFIAPGKRLEVVVDLAREMPERRFVITGEPAGPRGADYAQELGERAGTLPNLRVVPEWVSDEGLNEQIRGAAATLLPSTSDARASAAYTRSISNGTPVLAVGSTAISEPLEKTGSGIVAARSDAKAFREAIEQLEPRWDSIRAGVDQAQEVFGWQALAATFTSVYSEAAQA